MPKYDFKCSSCDNVQEVVCKIAELDDIQPECSECGKTGMTQTYLVANHAFMPPEALGRKHAPQEFRDMLKMIKKAHPGSLIRDR